MWHWIKKLIRLLWPKDPGRVKDFKMTDRTLSWILPNVSPRQAAIDHTIIDFRVDESLPWTVQDNVASDGPQQLVLVNVMPGRFIYRATVVDAGGQPGPSVEIEITNNAYDPPGSVESFTAVDSDGGV